MLLNKQVVRQAVAEKGKQCSKEFIDTLDRKVNNMILLAFTKIPKGTKRLTGQELE